VEGSSRLVTGQQVIQRGEREERCDQATLAMEPGSIEASSRHRRR